MERAKQQSIGFMVDSVPYLAVDGRYATSFQMAGGSEGSEAQRNARAFKVVDFLIQRAAQDRKKKPK
jgi:hypothetical protein